jgi:hypothetical protein
MTTCIKNFATCVKNPQIFVNAASTACSDLANKTIEFFNKHSSTIFLGLAATMTGLMAPKLFPVGVLVGFAGSKIIDSNFPLPQIATRISACLEIAGLVGTAVPHTANYMAAFPLGGGIVAGHYLYASLKKLLASTTPPIN